MTYLLQEEGARLTMEPVHKVKRFPVLITILKETIYNDKRIEWLIS